MAATAAACNVPAPRVILVGLFFWWVPFSAGWVPNNPWVLGGSCCWVKQHTALQAAASSIMPDICTVDTAANTTLEYSYTFQRHICKRANGTVVQSFVWLDQALHAFPTATLLPLPDNALSCLPMVAGGSTSSQTYPILPPDNSMNQQQQQEQNIQAITHLLQSQLAWFPSQVQQLLQTLPSLQTYPVSELRDRLAFLQQPLPPMAMDWTDPTVDWPHQCFILGYGAGMSVGQISHALQVVPQFLLRLGPTTTPLSTTNITVAKGTTGSTPTPPSSNTDNNEHHHMWSWYDQTPPVVLQMTYDRLQAWLAGTAPSATAALALLHWKGWEWNQTQTVLHAWPGVLETSLEPSWELYQSSTTMSSGRTTKSGAAQVRSTLNPDALFYLQLRLQLRPWQLQAMLKTHSRLTGYSRSKLQGNLEFWQTCLELSSAQLQQLVLQQPSLLGAAVETMQSRVDFWLQTVGLTVTQLRTAAVKQPTLLQYSRTANVQPKYTFFRETLEIHDAETLVRWTTNHPDIWGLSLHGNLEPSAEAFCQRVDNMTLPEYGQVVAQVPQVLQCRWKTNLGKKLDFLQNQLQLSNAQLKRLVQTTPRLLLQSIRTLQDKLDLVETSLQKSTSSNEPSSYRTIIGKNPALLQATPAALQRRLDRTAARMTQSSLSPDPSGMESLLTLTGKGRTTRQRRKVVLLEQTTNDLPDDLVVKQEFSCVSEAAQHAGMSVSNMYYTLRSSKRVLHHGQTYRYASAEKKTEEDSQNANETRTKQKTEKSAPTTSPVQALQNDLQRLYTHTDPDVTRLVLQVSGCAFPPEAGVRGRKRAGGLALHVPSWKPEQWQQMTQSVWKGRKFRLLQDRRTIILGYPYLRPSCPRCSLYACLEALRVVAVWMQTVSTGNVEIEIQSDNNYVIDLLENADDLIQMGESSHLLLQKKGRREETRSPREDHASKRVSNPDILYPLSSALYNIVKPNNDKTRHDVSIRFTKLDAESKVYRRVRAGAKLAAQLMYETVR